jgi:putative sigma-54 modulation protein
MSSEHTSVLFERDSRIGIGYARAFLKTQAGAGSRKERRMIPIKVRSKSEVEESTIRKFAERRISFTLDHLPGFHRLAISLEDVNGPKGGFDKHCVIVARFGFTSVVLEETQADWQSAIAQALHRLDRKATQDLRRVNRHHSRNTPRIRLKSSEERTD